MTLVVLGLIAIAVGTFTAHRSRENTRAMRAAVAKLKFAELLQRQRACELDGATTALFTAAPLDRGPAYCEAVTHAIASQPLQLVDVPPDVAKFPLPKPEDPEAQEHDRRAIEWRGKTTP